MNIYYIMPSLEDATRLNAILYSYFVTEDGVNFKNGYEAGTTEWLKYWEPLIVIDDRTINALADVAISQADRDFANGVIAARKTYQEAIDAGWISE